MVVIGGAVFLLSAFFVELLSASFNRLTIQQTLFRLDFRYWSPSLTYPLWLIFALLAIDAVTFRQPSPDTAATGKRSVFVNAVVFIIKVCLAILFAYYCVSVCIPIQGYGGWWYFVNLLLLAAFLMKWMLLYQTRKRTDFTPEMLDVRKRFLIMSLTITVELGILNFLFLTGLIRHFSTPTVYWFSFGAYSHWVTLSFVLICLATGITIFVITKWLAAIRRTCQANRQTSLDTNLQTEANS